MILVVLLIGAILIVAAVRNSQGALFSALRQDVPEFVVWAAAIVALGAIGFVPGLKPISRGLLALVILVIIVNNYKQITSGFASAWNGSGAKAASGTADAKSSAAPKVPNTLNDIANVANPVHDAIQGIDTFSKTFGFGAGL